MNPRSPTNFDTHVGNNLRMIRITRKMSQEALGTHLGLTFQQVQKYEKGTNKIPSWRLHKIAEIFKVDVDYFSPPKPANGAEVPEVSEVARFMASKEGITIANAMVRIADPFVRNKIVAAIEALSRAAVQAAEGRGQ
jgi:transcriptional regulator with XRE-family HTH domain